MPHMSKTEHGLKAKFFCEYNNDGIISIDIEKSVHFSLYDKKREEKAILRLKNNDEDGNSYTVEQMFADYYFDKNHIVDAEKNPSLNEIWNFPKAANSKVLNDFIRLFDNFDKYLNDVTLKNNNNSDDKKFVEIAEMLAFALELKIPKKRINYSTNPVLLDFSKER